MRVPLAALLILVMLASSPRISSAFNVTPNGFTSYLVDGVNNPTLNLVRGTTYTFTVNASGHPFWIKTVNSAGTANA